ncbi:unnamed protein product, partial [Prorocentrum cordatum]
MTEFIGADAPGLLEPGAKAGSGNSPPPLILSSACATLEDLGGWLLRVIRHELNEDDRPPYLLQAASHSQALIEEKLLPPEHGRTERRDIAPLPAAASLTPAALSREGRPSVDGDEASRDDLSWLVTMTSTGGPIPATDWSQELRDAATSRDGEEAPPQGNSKAAKSTQAPVPFQRLLGRAGRRKHAAISKPAARSAAGLAGGGSVYSAGTAAPIGWISATGAALHAHGRPAKAAPRELKAQLLGEAIDGELGAIGPVTDFHGEALSIALCDGIGVARRASDLPGPTPAPLGSSETNAEPRRARKCTWPEVFEAGDASPFGRAEAAAEIKRASRAKRNISIGRRSPIFFELGRAKRAQLDALAEWQSLGRLTEDVAPAGPVPKQFMTNRVGRAPAPIERQRDMRGRSESEIRKLRDLECCHAPCQFKHINCIQEVDARRLLPDDIERQLLRGNLPGRGATRARELEKARPEHRSAAIVEEPAGRAESRGRDIRPSAFEGFAGFLKASGMLVLLPWQVIIDAIRQHITIASPVAKQHEAAELTQLFQLSVARPVLPQKVPAWTAAVEAANKPDARRDGAGQARAFSLVAAGDDGAALERLLTCWDASGWRAWRDVHGRSLVDFARSDPKGQRSLPALLELWEWGHRRPPGSPAPAGRPQRRAVSPWEREQAATRLQAIRRAGLARRAAAERRRRLERPQDSAPQRPPKRPLSPSEREQAVTRLQAIRRASLARREAAELRRLQARGPDEVSLDQELKGQYDEQVIDNLWDRIEEVVHAAQDTKQRVQKDIRTVRPPGPDHLDGQDGAADGRHRAPGEWNESSPRDGATEDGGAQDGAGWSGKRREEDRARAALPPAAEPAARGGHPAAGGPQSFHGPPRGLGAETTAAAGHAAPADQQPEATGAGGDPNPGCPQGVRGPPRGLGVEAAAAAGHAAPADQQPEAAGAGGDPAAGGPPGLRGPPGGKGVEAEVAAAAGAAAAGPAEPAPPDQQPEAAGAGGDPTAGGPQGVSGPPRGLGLRSGCRRSAGPARLPQGLLGPPGGLGAAAAAAAASPEEPAPPDQQPEAAGAGCDPAAGGPQGLLGPPGGLGAAAAAAAASPEEPAPPDQQPEAAGAGCDPAAGGPQGLLGPPGGLGAAAAAAAASLGEPAPPDQQPEAAGAGCDPSAGGPPGLLGPPGGLGAASAVGAAGESPQVRGRLDALLRERRQERCRSSWQRGPRPPSRRRRRGEAAGRRQAAGRPSRLARAEGAAAGDVEARERAAHRQQAAAARERAAIRLQAARRGSLARQAAQRLRDREQALARQRAATRLQAARRGSVARRQVSESRAAADRLAAQERERELSARELAATRLQAALRGSAARRRAWALRQRLEDALGELPPPRPGGGASLAERAADRARGRAALDELQEQAGLARRWDQVRELQDGLDELLDALDGELGAEAPALQASPGRQQHRQQRASPRGGDGGGSRPVSPAPALGRGASSPAPRAAAAAGRDPAGRRPSRRPRGEGVHARLHEEHAARARAAEEARRAAQPGGAGDPRAFDRLFADGAARRARRELSVAEAEDQEARLVAEFSAKTTRPGADVEVEMASHRLYAEAEQRKQRAQEAQLLQEELHQLEESAREAVRKALREPGERPRRHEQLYSLGAERQARREAQRQQAALDEELWLQQHDVHANARRAGSARAQTRSDHLYEDGVRRRGDLAQRQLDELQDEARRMLDSSVHAGGARAAAPPGAEHARAELLYRDGLERAQRLEARRQELERGIEDLRGARSPGPAGHGGHAPRHDMLYEDARRREGARQLQRDRQTDEDLHRSVTGCGRRASSQGPPPVPPSASRATLQDGHAAAHRRRPARRRGQ